MTLRSALILASIAGLLFCIPASGAGAQKDCRKCAKESPTVGACIECAQQYEGTKKYTPAQLKQWCGANQPACYKGKMKSG